MLTSLALIFIVGLSFAAICKTIKLPRIIGMLLTGLILGPFVLDALDSSILGISAELRQIALVIILIKAGLSLDIRDLRKVGRPAILLSFLPACFEIVAAVVFAPLILNVSYLEGAIIGAVLGAVSPAIVVPKMVHLMDHGYGTDKSIPQMLLAGSSLDDVFVIVLFTTFVGIEQGSGANVMDFVNIPISIVLGILLGMIVGFILAFFFDYAFNKGHLIRNSFKVIVILGFSFLLLTVEELCKPYVAVSGLLAIMAMSMVIAKRSNVEVTRRLKEKYGKLWLAAEVILFVLVGAEVNINYIASTGGWVVLLVLACLVFRSIGVYICLLGTKLNQKERLFTIISYIPKATVQAAIGSIPLSLGLPCGEIVLSVAVISILITAPLGAIGMDLTYKKFLHKEDVVVLKKEVENVPSKIIETMQK